MDQSMSTYETPPPPPQGQHEFSHEGPLARPKKKSMAAPILISGLVGVAVGIAGTLGAVALVGGSSDEDAVAEPTDEPSVAPESASDSGASSTPSSSPSMAPAFEPTVDDFDVEISVKEQACFGSAGCNLTLRTEPDYVGSGFPVGTWEVTYEINGIEDAPLIRSFELQGDQIAFDDEARVSVPDDNPDINIEITDVREGFSNY